MSLGDLKVALVHDELTRRGGAEIVFEELARIFNQADVYALYAGNERMIINDHSRQVHTSFLQRFPVWFRRHPSRLLPLLPPAAEQFDLSRYDVVISSASGFAKSIITRVNVPHICFCHAPTRYLWGLPPTGDRRSTRFIRWPGSFLLHYLRLVDFAAAQRVDFFLANSTFTQRRIRNFYRRPSTVVYPPIDTAFYTPEPRGVHGRLRARHGYSKNTDAPGYFLAVGRLTRAKNFEQAVQVCEKMQLPLVVAGSGRELTRLRKIAGKYTRFVGRVSQASLRTYYRGARALLQTGEEDFGMVAAEALACGIPVIAYRGGGGREVVEHRVTGILYDEPRDEALAEALRQFLLAPRRFQAEALQRSALRFTRQRFVGGIEHAVAQSLERRYD
jgi:glycosyltransferase involved in cell wall biosynthesis